MWTCPACKRKFKNENQSHSCETKSIDEHLSKSSDAVKAAYYKVISEVNKLGKVNTSAVKNAILVSANSNFLSLKPAKSWLDVEFLLDEEADEFPIHKTFRLSKHKVAHYVRVGSADEIDSQLVGFIRRAYEIVR
jgi:hypothetical protein